MFLHVSAGFARGQDAWAPDPALMEPARGPAGVLGRANSRGGMVRAILSAPDSGERWSLHAFYRRRRIA